MQKPTTILALILIMSVVLSCRMAETLTGGTTAGTVTTLWSDVPPIEGATKADLEIPLAARLAIRAAMQGRVNFIAFVTSKSAQEVQNFYTKDRMKAAGWTPSEKGCIGDVEGAESQGAVCLFTRKEGGKEEGLAIVVATDSKTKQTQVFYARIDTSESS